jgi:subtilisin family serine protease
MAIRRLFAIAAVVLGLAGHASAATYQIIVECAYGTDMNAIAAAYGGSVLDWIPGSNTWLVGSSSPSPSYLPQGVIYAEANLNVATSPGTGSVVSSPSDPNWYRLQPAMRLIRADRASSFATGKGVVVADINSLVDYSHPSLVGHLTSGYDFVIGQTSGASLDPSSSRLNQAGAGFLDQSSSSFLDQATSSFLNLAPSSFLDQATATFLDVSNPAHGHGTLVAGIIAVLAPEAMIMPVRAFNDQGQADVFTISKSIYWAVQHGAQVINMSFGVSEYSKTLENAVQYASEANVVLVASAGNDSTNVPQYPAAFQNVLAIAATNLSDRKASFSNYGSDIFVDAPGVNIISSYPGGYYALVSGTSFSAPIVASEAALMLSLKDCVSKSDLAKGVVNIGPLNAPYSQDLGKGRVDFVNALSVNTRFSVTDPGVGNGDKEVEPIHPGRIPRNPYPQAR